jgi:seryl-tRNA synthetase
MWPISTISAKLDQILANQVQEKQAMSALSDAVATLTTGVTALATAVTNADAAIQKEITALTAAIANGTDTTAAIANIQQLSASLGQQATTLTNDTAALASSLPPAPPPGP